MGAVISFFTVLSAIVILVPLALGMELVVFLNHYSWQVSLIFWGLLLFFSFRSSRREKNLHDRVFIRCFPVCLLPVYCFLLSAVKEIVTQIQGFELVLAILFELPLCFCAALAGGLFIGLLGEKCEDPSVEAVVMVAGNLLLTLFFTAYGI